MKILFFCLIVMMIIPPAFAEGVTIKSVSYVPFSSNNANISGDKVIIDIMMNGGASEVTGLWTGAGLPDGKELSQNITIKIRNQSEYITHHFLNQGELLKYTAHYIENNDQWYGPIKMYSGAKCEPKPAWCFPIDTDRAGTGLDRILSINRIPSGQYARFSNGDTTQNIEVGITVNGTEYIGSIGSGQVSRGSTQFKTNDGNYIGSATWTGYSLTGQSMPNANNFVGTYTDKWRVAPLVSYTQYVESLTSVDTQLSLLYAQMPEGFDEDGASLKADYEPPTVCKDTLCSDVVSLINIHNAIVDKLTAQNIQIDYGAPTASTQNTLVEDGNIVDTLKRPIGTGEVVLTLNAESIGIVQNSGIPHIVNVSLSQCVSADNDCYFRIKVQNLGEVKSTFGVRVNGSIEQKITLDAGASTQVEIPFIGMEGINTGSIEVYDLTSGESTIKTYQVNVSAPKKFIPNSTEIYNDVEIKTDSTGMNQTAGDECKGIWTHNKTTEKYHCIEFDDIAEPTPQPKEQIVLAVPTQTPAPPQEAGSGYLWYLIIFLIGIIVAGLLNNNRGSRKNSNRAILIIILIIIGAVILALVLINLPALSEKIKEIQFLMNILEKLR